MSSGTGVNDGQWVHSLPHGAVDAPDESKDAATAMASPAPVPASTDPVTRERLDAAMGAIRILGREVRALRAEVEALRGEPK